MYTRTLNTRNTHPARGFYRPKTTAFYLVTEDKSFFIEDAIGEFLHICPLTTMAEEDELLCEIWQRSTADATEILHHHRHEEPERIIAISQGKQYLVPRYDNKEAMDEPEQVLASVIKALKKEQAKG